MTTQHIQEKEVRIFSLIFFNFSQHIHSNGYALAVGLLISMHNLCMELTVCTKMVAVQTSFEDFTKIGDPQQCLLKLTGQNCCSSYLISRGRSKNVVTGGQEIIIYKILERGGPKSLKMAFEFSFQSFSYKSFAKTLPKGGHSAPGPLS